MKLFGKKQNNDTEILLPEEELLKEKVESAASEPKEAGNFVMDIEGLDLKPEKETVSELRGATDALPDPEQIEEAIESAEQAAENVEQSVDNAEAVVKSDAEEFIMSAEDAVENATEEIVESTEETVEDIEEEAVEPAEEAIEAVAEETVESAEETVEAVAEETVESVKEIVEPVGEAVETAEEIAEEPDAEAAAEAGTEDGEKLSSVSYASVAQAVVNAKREPTGRYDRNAIDDETLLAELYALIGDGNTKQSAEPAEKETGVPVQTRPEPRPAARITPETLQAAPEEFIEVEEDTAGVPGWLKGVFLLLIALLLSAMTFYAVASDVIGKIF